jgi:hypothetical protein
LSHMPPLSRTQLNELGLKHPKPTLKPVFVQDLEQKKHTS